MIETFVLPNEIKIVSEHITSSKSVALGIWVRAGAVDEEDIYAGISHFAEHMMFKGTSKRSSKAIAMDFDKLGVQVDAFTGKEATCYYFKSLPENFEAAADILCDMVENSVLDREELDRERDVIIEEIKMDMDSPEDLVHDNFISLLFKDSSYEKTITGTASSLKRISRKVLKKYVCEHYTRDNIVVSVSGNYDLESIKSYFSGRFMNLKQSSSERKLIESSYEPGFKSSKKDLQQSHISMGTRAISITDTRSYAFALLEDIIGGGMSSRLFQKIREESGLAYTVYAADGDFSLNGYFEIYAAVSHANVNKTIDAIKKEIDILRDYPVTAEELSASKHQILSDYIFSQESSTERMLINGKNYLLLDKIFEPEDVIRNYSDVTIEDIDNVKDVISDSSSYSISIVSNRYFKNSYI